CIAPSTTMISKRRLQPRADPRSRTGGVNSTQRPRIPKSAICLPRCLPRPVFPSGARLQKITETIAAQAQVQPIAASLSAKPPKADMETFGKLSGSTWLNDLVLYGHCHQYQRPRPCHATLAAIVSQPA